MLISTDNISLKILNKDNSEGLISIKVYDSNHLQLLG
jgi:hypothetical protein